MALDRWWCPNKKSAAPYERPPIRCSVGFRRYGCERSRFALPPLIIIVIVLMPAHWNPQGDEQIFDVDRVVVIQVVSRVVPRVAARRTDAARDVYQQPDLVAR